MRIVRIVVSGLALATTLGVASARAECPMDLGRGSGWVLFSQHYMITFRPDPLQIEVGEPVALVLNVCTKDGEAAELVGVGAERVDDAATPAQRLKLSGGRDGRYRAEGLSFSSGGRWEIEFDVRSDGETEELTHEIVVK
ncbi:MAG: hypothetical protein JSR90_05010 [Proteobacteria bacterium]|nr:hypothetical protein [Pseudomonadota bacterium]